VTNSITCGTTVTPARRRKFAMASISGLTTLVPLLKRPLPLIPAPSTSPSSPITIGPFCQL
jgi:hypothetical protein